MRKSNGNRYSEEFKQGAVKLVLEDKQSIAEACRNLGVSRNAIERWLAAEADSHDTEKVRLKQLEEEIRYSLTGMSYAPLVFVSARDRWNLDGLLDRVAEVMEQLELKIPTGVLNRVLADAFVEHTPPVVGSAPLKLFYASMVGMTPPRIRLFVNNPACCGDNYLAFLIRTVRNAFGLVGLPVEIELRARPKKVTSIRSEPGGPRRRGSLKAGAGEEAVPEKKTKSAGRKPAPKRGAAKKKGGK